MYKQTGMEAIERLRFLASFCPPSTGKRKGGEKTQPFNRFHSHPGTELLQRFNTGNGEILPCIGWYQLSFWVTLIV